MALGATPLFIASQQGNANVVRQLLTLAVGTIELNTPRDNGLNALSVAAYFGHELVVKALLEAGASESKATDHGHSPLRYARERGHSRVVEALVSHSKSEVVDVREL